MILPRCRRKRFGHCEASCLSSSVEFFPFHWNYRELTTLLTLSESFVVDLWFTSFCQRIATCLWSYAFGKPPCSWDGIRTIVHMINLQESYHWAILTQDETSIERDGRRYNSTSCLIIPKSRQNGLVELLYSTSWQITVYKPTMKSLWTIYHL